MNKEQKDESSVATGDHSSNAAGAKKKLKLQMSYR